MKTGLHSPQCHLLQILLSVCLSGHNQMWRDWGKGGGGGVEGGKVANVVCDKEQ